MTTCPICHKAILPPGDHQHDVCAGHADAITPEMLIAAAAAWGDKPENPPTITDLVECLKNRVVNERKKSESEKVAAFVDGVQWHREHPAAVDRIAEEHARKLLAEGKLGRL